jgi:protocatechuate 3,4-dioxygenase beta subunit
VSLLLTLAARFVCSQPGVPIDGLVVNRVTGVAIPGASVTLFDRVGGQYQAVTDSSGRFRIASADPGQYEALAAKDGFVLLPAGRIQIPTSGDAVHLQFAMQFGNTQQASLTGRILDSQGKPLANAQVDLIVGPEFRHTTTTAEDGRFIFDKLPAGAYKLRASPPADHSGREVATYFPASIDEAGGQRLIVRGNADIDGFRLQTASVFHLRGVVLDETGKPAAHAVVKLVPMTMQPAHVFVSFDSRFLARDGSPGPDPEVGHVITGDDGRFEFASVRPGHWNLVSEAAPRIDPKMGFNLAAAGVASIFVGDGDLQGIEVRLNAPFGLDGKADWLVAQYHNVPPQRTIDGRPAPERIGYPIWFDASDGQSSSLALTVTRPDSTLILEHIRSGKYLVQALPQLANPAGTPGGHVQEYLAPGMLLNNRQVRQDPIEVGRSSGPIQLESGGWFDPDANHVPFEPLILGPGTVRGIVEQGAGAAVVLLPKLYMQSEMGQLVFCKPDGSFEARGVHPGEYYIAAFRDLDFEGLRAPELIPRIVSSAKSVQVKSGAAVEAQLAAFSWLD